MENNEIRDDAQERIDPPEELHSEELETLDELYEIDSVLCEMIEFFRVGSDARELAKRFLAEVGDEIEKSERAAMDEMGVGFDGLSEMMEGIYGYRPAKRF